MTPPACPRTDQPRVPTGPRRPEPRPSGRRASQRELEEAFLRWLADPSKPDEVPLGDADAPIIVIPLSRLLGRLSTSRRPLAADAAAELGLPEGTSIGDGAVELLLAVRDPLGLRCENYAAAVSYLRDLTYHGTDTD